MVVSSGQRVCQEIERSQVEDKILNYLPNIWNGFVAKSDLGSEELFSSFFAPLKRLSLHHAENLTDRCAS